MSWKKWALSGCGCVTPVVLLALLVLVPSLWGTIRTLFYLTFGWIGFLAESLPKMHVDGWAVAVGIGSLALFGSGLHLLLRRLMRPALMRVGERFEEAPSLAVEWRGRGSIAVVTGVVVMFVAGLCAVGLQRQVTWAVTSPEREWTYFGQGLDAAEAVYHSSAKGNLKQFGLAVHNYHDVYKRLPSGGIFNEAGQGQHGWLTLLLPYFENDPLYQQVHFDRPWHHSVNKPVFSTHIELFTQPLIPPSEYFDHNGFALSHHATNVWVMGPRSMTISQIGDGTSNTVFVGEVNARFRPWGHHANWRDPAAGINHSPDGFGSRDSRGGCLFMMGDGTVKFVSDKVDPQLLKAIGTANGGETVLEF